MWQTFDINGGGAMFHIILASVIFPVFPRSRRLCLSEGMALVVWNDNKWEKKLCIIILMNWSESSFFSTASANIKTWRQLFCFFFPFPKKRHNNRFNYACDLSFWLLFKSLNIGLFIKFTWKCQYMKTILSGLRTSAFSFVSFEGITLVWSSVKLIFISGH